MAVISGLFMSAQFSMRAYRTEKDYFWIFPACLTAWTLIDTVKFYIKSRSEISKNEWNG